jgi:indolepyruvate ferredoxin oxidoreductase
MDERFLKEEGAEIFTGNELILKGALESGCALITGYPGSPVSDIFDAAYANREQLKKRGILAEMANNEALAVARLNGSRMAGVRAMAVMKSVGLHVASDGLALGNLSEPNNEGGSIVIVGDDPWIDSTQINNDSRYLSQHLHMPVMEPATFQEMKDWVGAAFELSGAANLYITYLVTTNQADGGGTVWVHPNQEPRVNTHNPVTLETDRINLDTNVLLPPRTWDREATLPKRFERLLEEARKKELNKLVLPEKSSPRHVVSRGPVTLTSTPLDPVPYLRKYLSGQSPVGDGLQSAGMTAIGFISSGLSYCYLEHALTELGLSGRFPILKLGVTYPVDPKAVLELARQVESLYVIEEKRGFVETQVIQILYEAGVSVKVFGKKFPQPLAGIPETRGVNTSVLLERLIPLFLKEEIGLSDEERAGLAAEREILEATQKMNVTLPVRTPTFCPGCPHRDSSSVFLQIKTDFADPAYMKRAHGREPVDLVFHGETGCFTMLMFEPNKALMHNYSGMGLGGGTGAGADPFITNKQIVFLGDSTFFHSGMIAISDSIKSSQDITYVILDNKTTAMTGHQPTPGTDMNLMGEKTFTQSIEAITQAMAGDSVQVQRVNPEYRDSYRELLEETVLREGVKIIIADKECGLTYHRRVRKEQKRTLRQRGFLPEERHINVTPEVCEFCLECTTTTGCPGLTIENTLYGSKIVTDMTHCVSDGACAKVKACPSFEEVIVRRKSAPRHHAPSPLVGEGWDGGTIPPPLSRQTSGESPAVWRPPFPFVGKDVSDPFYIFTAGVGGQGAGMVSAVLVLAAHLEGYRVLFSDKKGLAIRNGGVYAHLLVSRSGGVLSPLVPYGKADLILGIDLLEAARGLDAKTNLRVAQRERTCAVVNTALSPTIRMLMGNEVADPAQCEAALQNAVRAEGYWGQDLSSVSEHYFGSKLYANMLLLGAACQLGRLPFTLEKLEEAVSRSVSAEDRAINLQAFHAGRALVVRPETFRLPNMIYTFRTLFQEKKGYLEASYGRKIAEAYRDLVEEGVLQLNGDDAMHRDFALRVYDLFHYEGLPLARRYADLVQSTAAKDRREWKHKATRAVIHNAFKVMAIKDEVYVAHLLTSPEKRARDKARYRIDASNGDRVTYRHMNRPEFVIFGRRIRWDMNTRDWQLNLMKRLKFLRRLLPGWHREEKEFRDWYLGLAGHFEAEHEKSYAAWVNILSCPETVRGYREIRAPKMQEARRKVEELLNGIPQRIPPPLWGRTKVGGSSTEVSAPHPSLPPRGGKESR